MNFAEVQIDSKVIKYIFIEASTFYDIRESDFLTFYSCGLYGRYMKKKKRITNNNIVNINISNLLDNFDSKNNYNTFEITENKKKINIFTIQKLTKIYFPDYDQDILIEYFSDSNAYYLYYFESDYLEWFTNELLKKID